jgi:DNA replication protein DnaC
MDEIIDFSKIDFLSDEEIKERKLKELAQKRQWRLAEVEKITPPLFQKTEQAQLPQSQLKQAKAWAWNKDDQKLNLLLYGATGAGKTRTAWIAMQLRYVKVGIMPYWLGAETFARRVISESNLMREAIKAPIMLLDDLGMERSTPTAESSIYELIRTRMDYMKPTIITTNYSPDQLIEKFTHKQTGKAIARRLRETSMEILY